MNSDWEEYITKRCEQVLINNKLDSSKREIECYKIGLHDSLTILNKEQIKLNKTISITNT
jgi:hypothetical protein